MIVGVLSWFPVSLLLFALLLSVLVHI
jgi:hypothetical protein